MSQPRLTTHQLILFGIALIPPTAVAIAVLFIVPQFTNMLAGFGADLPLSTRILQASYRWWLVLPVLTLAIGLSWPQPKDRAVAAVVAGTVLALSMFLFMLWACYGPIFALAAQI